MTEKFSDEQASRIISALDARSDRKTKDGAMVTSTWGTIGALDAANKSASAYLYGETDGAYMSGGFRIPDTMYLSLGDKVKVGINYATGDRWVEEVNVPSAYKKVAINATSGEILMGDGTAAPVPFTGGGGAVNLLPNGGFFHLKNGWTLNQNGDTTASWAMYTNTDATWILRDGETKAFDAVGGPYGETAYIYSTSLGTFEPYIMSDRLPCIAGEKYSLKVPVGTHRSGGTYAVIWFYDITGANIGAGTATSQTFANDGAKTGGPTLSGWRFLTIDGAVAPAGAQTMAVAIVMKTPYVSGSDQYLFIDQVMLTQSDTAQDYQRPIEPGVVTGSILLWPTNTLPAGYLWCNSSAASRTTYSDLFNVIGTTYGAGDGSTTFNVPNLNGRFPFGRTAEAIGSTGGASTHTHAGHSAHVVTQPSAHSVTDPTAHPAMSHSAHSGGAVSAHAAHTHDTPFIDNGPQTLSTTTQVFGASGTTRTRDYTGAFSGASGSYAPAQVSDTTDGAHTFTQPSAHSDHASFGHSGTAVSAHSGAAVDGHSAHDSPSNMPPYMILNYIIKT